MLDSFFFSLRAINVPGSDASGRVHFHSRPDALEPRPRWEVERVHSFAVRRTEGDGGEEKEKKGSSIWIIRHRDAHQSGSLPLSCCSLPTTRPPFLSLCTGGFVPASACLRLRGSSAVSSPLPVSCGPECVGTVGSSRGDVQPQNE
ncbi:hypothetical protein F2P81_000300 [Scophthalmus maximus]|uniref:Uncharacterized protein n=1 Tax=Scophthalmus maximus TaxID=52904 RepID=A0A6A4TIT4_SCOMX|nr:hypothetical protein F2P81_000300 [Scophthalmus maximus]